MRRGKRLEPACQFRIVRFTRVAIQFNCWIGKAAIRPKSRFGTYNLTISVIAVYLPVAELLYYQNFSGVSMIESTFSTICRRVSLRELVFGTHVYKSASDESGRLSLLFRRWATKTIAGSTIKEQDSNPKSIVHQNDFSRTSFRYTASEDMSKAIKPSSTLVMFEINVDSAIFYAFLHSLCKHKHMEEAEEFLLLNKLYFPLETEGFNIILNSYCNIMVDLVEAKRVWKQMSNYCILPDNTSYSHLIHCFSKVGNLCDTLRLYDQMKTRGYVPGLTVYNSLVYALTKENCLKEAQNVVGKITEAGLSPDTETYKSMIVPLCEGHKLDEARNVMDDMINNGFSPTIEIYHAFAKAEDINGTLKLLKRMNHDGYNPDSNTFMMIVMKFFELGDSGSALRMWSEMEAYNIVPDSSHYTTMVQGLVSDGWIPKAMELYDEMKSNGFPSDPKFEKIFEKFISSNKDHWKRGKESIVPPNGRRMVKKRAADIRIHQGLGKLIF